MKEPMFKIKEEDVTADYGSFVIEPLETGFGYTLGNALRRVLLSAIPGVAVTSVKISGVRHKFSTIPGVRENVVDLLLNVKGLHFRLAEGKTTAIVQLSAKGPAEVTAAELELSDGVEVINKTHYLAGLSDKKSKLDMELTLEKGYGYSLDEERKSSTVGIIPTDAIFSPVRRVSYTVAATRVGRQTNLDKLVLQIWTNGVVAPRVALDEAARVLASYFTQVYEPKAVHTTDGAVALPSISDDILRMTIDELDLPTRIYNSLRNGNIETLGQLLSTPRKELMSMRNMGGKSIAIIEDKLKEKGISLSV